MSVMLMFRLLITYPPGVLFPPFLTQYAICQQLTVSQITAQQNFSHAVSRVGKNLNTTTIHKCNAKGKWKLAGKLWMVKCQCYKLF